MFVYQKLFSYVVFLQFYFIRKLSVSLHWINEGRLITKIIKKKELSVRKKREDKGRVNVRKRKKKIKRMIMRKKERERERNYKEKD